MDCTGQGNYFELIPMVKMETIHPVEGSFGHEFSSIYNRSELWRPEVARLGTFLRKVRVSLEKRPLTENFQNSVLKVFITSPIYV